MSIKSILSQEIEARTEEVKFQGTTYTLSGSPNINLLGDALMSEEAVTKKLASHYTTVTKSAEPFHPKIVMQVKMVAAALHHEDDPEKRYDDTEIAGLAVRSAGLFLKLSGAASKVFGLADASDDPDVISALGLGKQKSGDQPTSPSAD